MGSSNGTLSRTLSVRGRNAVTVHTTIGDLKAAGSINLVYIIFHDTKGNKSNEIKLRNTFRKHYERGRTEKFRIRDIGGHLVDIAMIEIWREGLLDDDLFLDLVVVDRMNSEKRFDFPIHRWISKGKHLFIRRFDSSLPQQDPNLPQRRRELETKRAIYQLDRKVNGLPVQSAVLPDDQAFSNDYQWDLKVRKQRMFAVAKLKQLTTAPDWTSISDIYKLYSSKVLPRPSAAEDNIYLDDDYFAEQRLAGCNPTMICLCTEIPDNLAVTSEMLEPLLEGRTVDKALTDKRLFLVDYATLDGVEITDKNLVIVAPLLLFYRTDAGKLLPVAIQLMQTPADDNPVFSPNDPPYTWYTAKLWCNMADASMHQSKAHLGFTHLMMESICTVTHRQMSPSHPVFRLLMPHFLYLIAINHLALARLVSPGGSIDKMMSIGRLGVFDVIRRVNATWRMDVNGLLPRDLENRGVADVAVLPHYPYRDDALLLYKAIEAYVRTVVDTYYDTEEKILEDHELQAWAAELSRPYSEGGADIKGVPGNGRLTNCDDIAAILTFAIFTSSVQHAAVNFNQYDNYGFPPAYPSLLNGEPPKDKSPISEEQVLQMLPNKDTTIEIMLVTRLLSERGTNALGDFEVRYSYDPVTVGALEKLQAELKDVRKTIQDGNKSRKYPYTILDPAEIPNSISI